MIENKVYNIHTIRQFYKTFSFITDAASNKLEHLYLTNLFRLV